ncbi:MAG: MASE3 domain-containing protein [Halodesulfurarchaeum sp.]
MQRLRDVGENWPHITLGVGGLGALYLIQLRNYLLFHSLVEISSVLVSFALFVVVWNARDRLDNAFLAVVGIGYLFVGGLDLLHTLAYSGMGVFPAAGANLPTQLWIVSRYTEAISLLGAGIVGYATRRGRLDVTWDRRALSLLGSGMPVSSFWDSPRSSSGRSSPGRTSRGRGSRSSRS